MQTEKRERVRYFDLLRVLSVFFIVVLNTVAQSFGRAAVGGYAWTVCNIFDSIALCAVPVLVMISGALFLNPQKQLDYRNLFRKNLLRLATAFVFWSAAYAVFDRLQGVRWRSVVFNFLRGGEHLWFLYMIAGLYLLVPVLRKMTESRRLTKYFLILWLAFSVLTPTLALTVSYFKEYLGYWIETVAGELNLSLAVGYAGCFVLGHYLHENELSKKLRRVIYALGVCGAAATAFLTYLFSQKKGYTDMAFYQYLTLGVILEAAAVFVFFKYHAPTLRRGWTHGFLLNLSECGFGICLVHMMFLRAAAYLPVDLFAVDPILGVVGTSVCVFLLSWLVSYIFNKIPFVNRYLV